MNPIIRKNIADGVFFSSVKESRFKTMRISANMLVPLTKDDAAAYSLLSGVLSHSCKAYPDFTLLSKKLSSLYGASLSCSVRKAGDTQVVSLTASGIDDRYAFAGESVACELSKLLCGVIFEPNLNGNEFCLEEVEQERRQLLDVVDSEFNDKRTYANAQLISNMCADEIYGMKRYGTVESIKAITPSSLYDAWQKLLKTAKFEIIYIGDSPADKAEQVFTDAFKNLNRAPISCDTQIIKTVSKVKNITDEMELSQSKMVMGFRTGVAVADKEVVATSLMCAILGGTANSKLFCNVREKQSLCYYCAARYTKLKGIMTIDCGVEGDNIEKATEGILKEVEDMKNGVITDFEVEATKLAVVNSLKSANDSVGGIESWYSDKIIEGNMKTVDEVAQLYMAVTKEEIINAAQKLSLDTIYVLKNK